MHAPCLTLQGPPQWIQTVKLPSEGKLPAPTTTRERQPRCIFRLLSKIASCPAPCFVQCLENCIRVFAEAVVDLLVADPPLLVNDRIAHLRHSHLFPIHSILPDRYRVPVRKDWKGEIQVHGQSRRFLRSIHAHPKDYRTFVKKFFYMGPQLHELLAAHTSTRAHIEDDDDFLFSEVVP